LLNNRRFFISPKNAQIKEPSVLVFFEKLDRASEDCGVFGYFKNTKESVVFMKETFGLKQRFFFLGQFFSEPRFYIKTSVFWIFSPCQVTKYIQRLRTSRYL
jgi:hypothetical protein